MTTLNHKDKKTDALLKSISEALTAYMTYQARCGMSPAYSEYLLYDPIVRVAHHLNWRVQCEFPLPKSKCKKSPGDHKRVDFLLTSMPAAGTAENKLKKVAIEVKWIPNAKKSKAINVKKDVQKLATIASTEGDTALFLVLAGVHCSNKHCTMPTPPKLTAADHIIKKHIGTCYPTGCTRYGVTVFKVFPARNK